MVRNIGAIVCILIAASSGKGINPDDEPKRTQEEQNKIDTTTTTNFGVFNKEGKLVPTPLPLFFKKERTEAGKKIAKTNTFCQLSHSEPKRPFPSLNFCFRSNQNACCIASQDKIIEENYRGVMPEDCSSQWIIWEILHCVGCHKDAPQVIDQRTKTVWLCREFVERIYFETNTPMEEKDVEADEKRLKKPHRMTPTEKDAWDKKQLLGTAKKFDKCGFVFKEKVYNKDEEGNDVEVETENDALVYPSKMYKNAYALFDDPDLKPAFMKDFIFRIDMNDKMERDKVKNTNHFVLKQRPRCFSSSSFMTASAALLSAAAVSIFA